MTSFIHRGVPSYVFDKIRLVFRCGLEEWTFDVRLPTRREVELIIAHMSETNLGLPIPNVLHTRKDILIHDGGELPPHGFLSAMDRESFLNYLDAAHERLLNGVTRLLPHEFIPLPVDPPTAWGRLVDPYYDVLGS